jgi:hypothetical protein
MFLGGSDPFDVFHFFSLRLNLLNDLRKEEKS